MNKQTFTVGLLALLGYISLAASKGKKFMAPVKGRISSPFGERISPTTGKKVFHNGIDVAVPIGTPLYAPAIGTISGYFETDAGGRQIIITHENGYLSGYAHLNQRLYKKGTKLKKGQKFAYSGNTGITTGAHVHLSLRKNGKYLNPAPFYKLK